MVRNYDYNLLNSPVLWIEMVSLKQREDVRPSFIPMIPDYSSQSQEFVRALILLARLRL